MGKINIDLTDYKSKLSSVSEIVKELSKIIWNSENAVKFYKKRGIEISSIVNDRLSHSHELYDLLNKFDYKSLIDKIQVCEYKCDELKTENFDDFNEPYQVYINSTLTTIYKHISLFLDAFSIIRPNEYLNDLVKGLQQLLSVLNPNVNELFDHFKYGNKNYVIFGKNGAGKTTLLKQISSTLFKNAVVIPANRSVTPYSASSITWRNDYNLNQKLEDHNAVTYLSHEIEIVTLKAYESGSCDNILTKKFYTIFSSLGIDREIFIDDMTLYLKGNNIEPYLFANGSDGEKSIAYIIMATLLAPQHSFLFIDEPERHLNGALMRNLFNRLEAERPDLRFVYLTHITDFVESRKNVELIYLEKTDSYNKWNFKKIKDYEDISLDVLLDIEGTKNDIIFCEGTRDSIDCKILECIYPEYEIKPVGSCEQVKLNTKGLNGKESLLRRKAYGVVDNDYMQHGEIEALKKSKIFAIGFNEWENFLIHSEILSYINERCLNKDLTITKDEIITYIKVHGRTAILSDFITKRYTRMFNSTRLSYNDNLSEQLDEINKRNKDMIIREVEMLNNEIEQNDDYDKLVSMVPAKMLLNSAANGVGLSSGKDYVDMVVKYLKLDKVFNEQVKQLLGISFV